MHEWIRDQLAKGLPALTGTTMSGTLAVKQDLLNEVLAEWLAGRDAAAASNRLAEDLDVRALMKTIRRASVRAEPGVVMLDFAIGVGPEAGR